MQKSAIRSRDRSAFATGREKNHNQSITPLHPHIIYRSRVRERAPLSNAGDSVNDFVTVFRSSCSFIALQNVPLKVQISNAQFHLARLDNTFRGNESNTKSVPSVIISLRQNGTLCMTVCGVCFSFFFFARTKIESTK